MCWRPSPRPSSRSTSGRSGSCGGIGNLIDRLANGRVTDMICLDFVNFPVFNVADCFITVGCFALIVYVIFLDRTEDKKRENTPTEP